jgi:hypothetical protein
MVGATPSLTLAASDGTTRQAHHRRRREVMATLPIVLGLPELEAAAAIGVSQTKFREMVDNGMMPQPRNAEGKWVFDIDELRAAFKGLPHRGEDSQGDAEEDTWADLQPEPVSGV